MFKSLFLPFLIVQKLGNYSRMSLEFQFVRSMGYYLIQIYIPSGLIVIISWVSFWLNRAATPARVSLGVTTVLTMTTLMSSTNAALPKISYVKSIDIFLGTCFVMVFASLLGKFGLLETLGQRYKSFIQILCYNWKWICKQMPKKLDIGRGFGTSLS